MLLYSVVFTVGSLGFLSLALLCPHLSRCSSRNLPACSFPVVAANAASTHCHFSLFRTAQPPFSFLSNIPWTRLCWFCLFNKSDITIYILEWKTLEEFVVHGTLSGEILSTRTWLHTMPLFGWIGYSQISQISTTLFEPNVLVLPPTTSLYSPMDPFSHYALIALRTRAVIGTAAVLAGWVIMKIINIANSMGVSLLKQLEDIKKEARDLMPLNLFSNDWENVILGATTRSRRDVSWFILLVLSLVSVSTCDDQTPASMDSC